MADDLAGCILYRDADILVLNKPAGLAVHRAPGAGPTVEASLPSIQFGLKWLPGLAHRLDRGTSGCLVLGRHPEALRRLNRLFAEQAVEKTYWAIVEGVPAQAEGCIELPLLKVRRDGVWSMVVDRAGLTAVTAWRKLGEADGRSWLELRPSTGRMHQLRVHCAALGHPVVGDERYGRSARLAERLHLHARSVRFTYPPRRQVEAVAPAPMHMLPALGACGAIPNSS